MRKVLIWLFLIACLALNNGIIHGDSTSLNRRLNVKETDGSPIAQSVRVIQAGTGLTVTKTSEKDITFSVNSSDLDVVPIVNGGTSKSTANEAFNALVPSQTGNSGKFLRSDATDTSWDLIDETDLNLTDITENDASISRHGFLPKLSNVAIEFLNGEGGYTTISSTDLDDTTDIIYDGDFSTTGIMTRTASNTYSGRTITGTSLSIDVTDGDGVLGNPTIDLAENISDLRKFFYGTLKETFDALVTSDGATVTMSLEQTGGGDLTMQFSDGNTTFDCTPTATTTLTAGSDSSPTENFVYLLQSDKALTVSTSSWPASGTSHIKIAYFLVPSASFVQTYGTYINQNWNDHLQSSSGQGHLSHMTERTRRDGVIYISGVGGSGTDGYLTPTVNNVEYSHNSGVVFQLHEHIFPSIDTATGDTALVVNQSGSAYTAISNLFDITEDSTGTSIGSNKYFNLVFWGVGNKGGEFSPLMVNLPSGVYNNVSDAINDVDSYDDFSIPAAYKTESSTGFLIARVSLQKKITTWDIANTSDLRGTTPSSASGSISSAQTTFSDTSFEITNATDSTKILNFEVSGVTTGNTRTLTAPDASGTIALTSQSDGTIDHGADVSGLTDDDHTIYILADGTRAFSGAQSLGDNNITNVGDIALDTISSDAGTSVNVSLGGDAGDDFIVDTDTLVVEGDNDRVGIGTTSPSTALHINKEVVDDASYSYDSNALMVVHQTETSTTVLNDPQDVLYLARQGTNSEAFGAKAKYALSRFENDGVYSRTRLDLDLANENFDDVNVMTWLSSQKVGIGTTSPDYTLDVAGPINNFRKEYFTWNGAYDADRYVELGKFNSRDGAAYITVSDAGAGTGGTTSFFIQFSYDMGVEDIKVYNFGDTDEYPLSSNDYVFYWEKDTDVDGYLALKSTGGTGGTITAWAWVTVGGTNYQTPTEASQPTAPTGYTALDDCEYIYSNAAGDVGIGTTSPDGILHVKGGSGDNLYIETENDSFIKFVDVDNPTDYTFGQFFDYSDGLGNNPSSVKMIWTYAIDGSDPDAINDGILGINGEGTVFITDNGVGDIALDVDGNILVDNGYYILESLSADPSTSLNQCGIFGKDVSAVAEVFAIDEQDNTTQLSPHNSIGEWRFYSENIKTGRVVEVNLEAFFKHYDEANGTDFFNENMPLKDGASI